MPRARIPSASLVASADALILPWLAPRAFVESPVSRRRLRRDGRSSPTQEEKEARAIADADQGSRCLRTRTKSSSPRASQLSTIGTACRVSAGTRAPHSIDRRYIDIASFAHQHARGYATSATISSQPTDITPSERPRASTTADTSSSTRYSSSRSWRKQLQALDEDLLRQDPDQVRAKLIAQAKKRIAFHAKRLHRDAGRHREDLLYDGQYRSLRRLIISLKQWDVDTEDVSKDTPVDTEDELWLLNTFAALDRSVYPRLHALTTPITLQHAPECREHALRLLDNVHLDGVSRLFSNWHKHKEQQKLYQGTLIYMLDHTPGYAQDLLTLLATDEQLPCSAPLLADALAHLARLHVKGEYPAQQGWEESPKANVRKFITTFLNCTPFIDTAVYSQDLLHSLVVLADIEDLKKIYSALIESGTRLSIGTMLHFASAFGEAGEFRYAIQCLERRLAVYTDAARIGIVNTQLFHWTCAVILRGSMHAAKEYHETPAIVAAMVQLGVKMDLLLYDVVMHNAMDAGDFATAFKVFNSLESNGLSPDHYTFSILLHGCATQHDPGEFKTFAEFCCRKAKELKDTWLATDFVHYAYACEQSKPVAARNSNAIWRAYLDLFDLAPLQPFVRDGSRAMKDAIDEESLNVDKQRLAPKPATLYLMLQTEIQTLENLGVHYLERLYKTFKHAISSTRAHPSLVSLAQNPIVWNAFLFAFCRRNQYASASAVIKDMGAHGCPPNIYSWNIFMQAFFKSGQVAAADRVFELMRARGVDPDAFTYGTMVRGYAKAQLTDRIGETMQHIPEDAQLEPDLLRALGQVQARADLTTSLERNRLAKMRKDAEEAERKAREEEKRFEVPQFRSLFARAVTFREPKHWDHGTVEEADDFMEPDDDESATSQASAGAGIREQTATLSGQEKAHDASAPPESVAGHHPPHEQSGEEPVRK
ncbi:Protein Rf1, mitochondrial [Stagonosporopsis vannaccii]|nr:Protein Rf1, mitochondrial [Stagonosporopsis vannaccii]